MGVASDDVGVTKSVRVQRMRSITSMRLPKALFARQRQVRHTVK